MPMPVLGQHAQRLYDELSPLAIDDAANGYALAWWCATMGYGFEIVEDWARDTDDDPGWSILVDLDRAPDVALPWLAQFVGVQVQTGADPADTRIRIANTDGWKRGTVAALRGAALPFLTGAQSVFVFERDSSPYHLTVVTRTAESGDAANQAKILAALMSQKPAGLVLNYEVHSGQEYALLFANNATYQTVFTKYATYNGLLNDVPGT